jgi:hypothetical protein
MVVMVDKTKQQKRSIYSTGFVLEKDDYNTLRSLSQKATATDRRIYRDKIRCGFCLKGTSFKKQKL